MVGADGFTELRRFPLTVIFVHWFCSHCLYESSISLAFEIVLVKVKQECLHLSLVNVIIKLLGSGCGSVGRAVASNSRDPQFESSHCQKFILNTYCQLCWKDENKEKEAGNGPFFNKVEVARSEAKLFRCQIIFFLETNIIFLFLVFATLLGRCKSITWNKNYRLIKVTDDLIDRYKLWWEPDILQKFLKLSIITIKV